MSKSCMSIAGIITIAQWISSNRIFIITNVALTPVFELFFPDYIDTFRLLGRAKKIYPHELSVHTHHSDKFPPKTNKRQFSHFVLSQVHKARFLCLALLVVEEFTITSRTNCTTPRSTMSYGPGEFKGNEVSSRACSWRPSMRDFLPQSGIHISSSNFYSYFFLLLSSATQSTNPLTFQHIPNASWWDIQNIHA